MICKYCHNITPDNSTFCSACGANQTSSSDSFFKPAGSLFENAPNLTRPEKKSFPPEQNENSFKIQYTTAEQQEKESNRNRQGLLFGIICGIVLVLAAILIYLNQMPTIPKSDVTKIDTQTLRTTEKAPTTQTPATQTPTTQVPTTQPPTTQPPTTVFVQEPSMLFGNWNYFSTDGKDEFGNWMNAVDYGILFRSDGSVTFGRGGVYSETDASYDGDWYAESIGDGVWLVTMDLCGGKYMDAFDMPNDPFHVVWRITVADNLIYVEAFGGDDTEMTTGVWYEKDLTFAVWENRNS